MSELGTWGPSDGGITVLEPPPRRQPRRSGGGAEPPDRWNGDGDGGGGGGDDSDGEGDGERRPKRSRRQPPNGAAELGFGLMLLGLGTLFVAFLGTWLVFRRTAGAWPPPGTPRPPAGLWLSTVLLVANSAALVRAVRARRVGDGPATRRWLASAAVLGLLFLAAQGRLWSDLLDEGVSLSAGAYGTLFFSLTGLHAIHVVGGLIYLGLVVSGARAAMEPVEPGGRRTRVEFCAVYWHFLGVVWIPVFGVLYFAG